MRSELEFEAILVAMAGFDAASGFLLTVLYLRYLSLWVCRILLEYLPEWYKVVYVAA